MLCSQIPPAKAGGLQLSRASSPKHTPRMKKIIGRFPPMPSEVYVAMQKRPAYGVSPSGVYDLHHALVDKDHVMGMPDEERAKIHNVCNLIRIPHEWNVSHANVPSREEAFRILCDREGRDNVLAFFHSINFKVRPFILE